MNGETGDTLGYDDCFLRVPVPLPVPSTPATRLDYPHFTVLLDDARRLASVTAVMIDGASLVDLPRSGEWHLDSRLPAERQTGGDVYARNDLDRGHLVRRRDPGWGDRAAEAMEATFAYPNAAPQAASFNQSRELWLGLEDHVLAYADALDHRVVVFTAPVLDPDDPPYRGVLLPRRFWKVAVWRDGAGGPAAAAFVLDQSDLLDESQGVTVEPLGEYRTFQVAVADVEAIAGIDLGLLVDADVRGASVRGEPWVELASIADIRLS